MIPTVYNIIAKTIVKFILIKSFNIFIWIQRNCEKEMEIERMKKYIKIEVILIFHNQKHILSNANEK